MMGVTIPPISCVTGFAERANFGTQKPYHSSSMHTLGWYAYYCATSSHHSPGGIGGSAWDGALARR